MDPRARNSEQGDVPIQVLLFKPFPGDIVPSLCSNEPHLVMQQPLNNSF